MSAVDASEPFVVTPEQSADFWSRDALWSVLVSGDRTRGDFTMIEQLMPARNGAPLHVHDRLHEYFYLIEGEISFQIGDRVVSGTTGSAVCIPLGTPHGFVVVSDTARVLNMYTPGGFDDRLQVTATPATSKTLPPPGTPTDQPTEQAQAEFAERLRQLHNERWAGDTTDLLADQRD